MKYSATLVVVLVQTLPQVRIHVSVVPSVHICQVSHPPTHTPPQSDDHFVRIKPRLKKGHMAYYLSNQTTWQPLGLMHSCN
jgi:hypothetical protein